MTFPLVFSLSPAKAKEPDSVQSRRTKASPAWVLSAILIYCTVCSATVAPKVAISTSLVCSAHRPDYISPDGSQDYQACARDSTVQAAIGTLTIANSLVQGVISCVTGSWWGQFSDRQGRVPVVVIATVGTILNDSILTIFATFLNYPRGYWFILLGPLVEACLGGVIVSFATNMAYLTDFTPPASRSYLMCQAYAMVSAGRAIGPTIGSLVERQTGNPLLIYYLAIFVNSVLAVITWFFRPESRLSTELARSYAAYQNEPRTSIWKSVVSPFALFLPVRRKGGKGGRDFSIPWMVVGMAVHSMLLGIIPYELQFASFCFGWVSEKLGYLLTAKWALRVVLLLVGMPKLMAYLKQRRKTSSQVCSELVPLVSRQRTHLDLTIARASLFIDFIGHLALGLWGSSEQAYVASTMFTTLAGGFWAAWASAIFEAYRRCGGTESGELFGALGVLDSIFILVGGPAVFGMTFVKTIKTFPSSIFLLAAAICLFALVALMIVSLPEREAEEEHLAGTSSDSV